MCPWQEARLQGPSLAHMTSNGKPWDTAVASSREALSVNSLLAPPCKHPSGCTSLKSVLTSVYQPLPSWSTNKGPSWGAVPSFQHVTTCS